MTTWDGPTFERLKEKQRANDYPFPSIPGLRSGRCLSWLGRAEQEMGKDHPDYDAAFIFYWIAFNAAYAEDRSEERLERRERWEGDDFYEYFDKTVRLDVHENIHNVIRMRYWGRVVEFVKNKYLYQPFWHHHNGRPGYEEWESWFQDDVNSVDEALGQWDPQTVLSILFDRLYVLRNQLIHGGATWKSKANRRQVKEGAMIMAFLVPRFIELMMDSPDTDWGTAFYPYVEDPDEQ